MYINYVLSYLNAWETLKKEHAEVFGELEDTLSRISSSEFLPPFMQRENYHLEEKLTSLNWEADVKIPHNTGNNLFPSVDLMKSNIGLDIIRRSRLNPILSYIFVKYPLLHQISHIRIFVIIMLCEGGLSSTFITIRDQLRAFYPLLLKNPFVILGVSSTQAPIEVDELSSKLDTFLIETLGLSLTELKLSAELERYDFKEIPPENRKIFHLACAMANQSGGGIMLFGINNDGDIKGLPRNNLDVLKLRITQTIGRNCHPQPVISLLDFDDPSDPHKCVLVVYVQELEQKPCMADEKVYIRVGSETRPARSEEIRRLILR
jgi:hypothetical protein